jgi:hypothetical protein
MIEQSTNFQMYVLQLLSFSEDSSNSTSEAMFPSRMEMCKIPTLQI